MRRIVVVIFEGVQALDVVGPVEVFADAGAYRVDVAAATTEPVRTSSGLVLTPHHSLAGIRGGIDTLIVAGGQGTRAAVADADVVRQVKRLAARSRRIASVCSGAFILAQAGLLDGKRATTHWSVCELLAQVYPSVNVESDPIYTRDGNVWTSAGVTAGMDLALALVEDDLGRDAALAIARRLVLFLRRPGNQSQFSAQLQAQTAERDSLRDVQRWIADHPGDDLTVPRLADRAGMSPRNFARSFAAEIGVTPARYVERVRLEAARRLLEESEDGVDSIARRCGFGTAETMRRTFLRTLHLSPAEYRRRFRTAA